MSPEQCRGEVLDRRSDVFSLGILLYELTTTRKLFYGNSDFAVLKRIAHKDAPSPARCVADYPPELEAIVKQALTRDKSKRYQTARELQEALDAFVKSHKFTSSPARLGSYMRLMFPEAARECKKLTAQSEKPSTSKRAKKLAKKQSGSQPIINSAMLRAIGPLGKGAGDEAGKSRWRRSTAIYAGIGLAAFASIAIHLAGMNSPASDISEAPPRVDAVVQTARADTADTPEPPKSDSVTVAKPATPDKPIGPSPATQSTTVLAAALEQQSSVDKQRSKRRIRAKSKRRRSKRSRRAQAQPWDPDSPLPP